MSFTNLIGNQEEKYTSPCQDYRCVKVNNFVKFFKCGPKLMQSVLAVNYNSMLGGTSVFTRS